MGRKITSMILAIPYKITTLALGLTHHFIIASKTLVNLLVPMI